MYIKEYWFVLRHIRQWFQISKSNVNNPIQPVICMREMISKIYRFLDNQHRSFKSRYDLFFLTIKTLLPKCSPLSLISSLLQDGDRRAAGHFCQHAWCFIIPAGGFISLCCCQQPQEAGMMCASIFEEVSVCKFFTPLSIMDHCYSSDLWPPCHVNL